MKFLALMIILVLFIAGCMQQDQKCGIEQCHGLEMTCGSDVPDACTEIYKLGDFCRIYFSGCEIVNGICMKVSNTSADILFSKCKLCVSYCDVFSDPTRAFECEENCRTFMKTICETDEDCACGKDIETGECFFGNKKFVDTSQQCPDYCTGIAGNLVIKCVNNACVQKSIG